MGNITFFFPLEKLPQRFIRVSIDADMNKMGVFYSLPHSQSKREFGQSCLTRKNSKAKNALIKDLQEREFIVQLGVWYLVSAQCSSEMGERTCQKYSMGLH